MHMVSLTGRSWHEFDRALIEGKAKIGVLTCLLYTSWTNTVELTGDFKTGSVGHKYILGYTYSFFNYTQYNGWKEGDTWGPGLNQVVALHHPHLADVYKIQTVRCGTELKIFRVI